MFTILCMWYVNDYCNGNVMILIYIAFIRVIYLFSNVYVRSSDQTIHFTTHETVLLTLFINAFQMEIIHAVCVTAEKKVNYLW